MFICDICYAKAYCGGNTCPFLHPLKQPFPFHKKASVCFKYQIAFDHHVHMKQTWSVVKLKTTTFTWRDLKCSETKNHNVHMKQTLCTETQNFWGCTSFNHHVQPLCWLKPIQIYKFYLYTYKFVFIWLRYYGRFWFIFGFLTLLSLSFPYHYFILFFYFFIFSFLLFRQFDEYLIFYLINE